MRVSVTDAPARTVDGCAVLGVFEPPFDRASPLFGHVAPARRAAVVPDLHALTWLSGRRLAARRLVFASLGTPAERRSAHGWCGSRDRAHDDVADRHALRLLGAAVERACFEADVAHLVIAPLTREADVAWLLEGILLRARAPMAFRRRDIASTLTRVTICARDVRAMRARVRRARELARATNLARDLADLPPNAAHPAPLAARMADEARAAGLSARVVEAPELAELGMGLLLAVGQAGRSAPRLLVVEHRPDEGLPTLCVVGKGVTFDAGGYHLKRGRDLHLQGYDMAGAAAGLAALTALARRRLPVHAVGLFPLADNGIGPQACRPGDIVRAMDGTYVLVEDTDAEGRLILADALVYARRFRPRLTVDVATLTAAAHQALGVPFAALFSDDDGARDLLLAAGRRSDDLLWPMPIHPWHTGQLSHHKARLRNTGPSAGAASVAAAFLREFAPRRWAHVDLGGQAVAPEGRGYVGRGATGFGTRLLVHTAEAFAGEGPPPDP